MKILYLHNTPLSSEEANLVQVKSMCKAFASLGHEVILSLPESEAAKDYRYNSQDAYRVSFRKALSRNPRIAKYLNTLSINKAIRQVNPDLCYVRSPIILRQAAKSKVPIIMELHNKRFHEAKKWLDAFWKRSFIKLVNAGRIAKVVCISEALTQYWIQQGIAAKYTFTAHDGVDGSQFAAVMSKEQARTKLGLPAEARIVSYVGRLYENRRIGDIIQLAADMPDTHFCVVGGPQAQVEKYRGIAASRKLQNIIFSGQVPHAETPLYLFAADVLLGLWSKDVPTINYCSPLKVFEYMAAERIVVAHGFPTIREVLRHGENAYIANPESYNDLRDKVGEALENIGDNKIANTARAEVMKLYTWEQRVKNILGCL